MISLVDATIAVTFTDIGDTITLNSHKFKAGDRIVFSSITSTTGITTSTNYYVVNPTTNTFQVAASVGGAVIDLVTSGYGELKIFATFGVKYQNIGSSLAKIPTNVSTLLKGLTYSVKSLKTFTFNFSQFQMAKQITVPYKCLFVQTLKNNYQKQFVMFPTTPSVPTTPTLIEYWS